MIQFGAPGVYIVEASSGVRPITTVATSITAFVDYFAEGMLDQAVQIFGMSDFERLYGGIDPSSPASYAIQQFFLNGGSSAYVVRTMVHPAPPNAAIDIPSQSGTTFSNNSTISAVSPGAWGNRLRVTVTSPGGSPPGPFNVAVIRYDSAKPNAKPVVIEQYLALSVTPGPRYYVTQVNTGSAFVTVTPDTSTPGVPATNGSLGTALTVAGISGLNNLSSFTVSIGASAARSVKLSTLPAAPTLSNLRDAVARAIQTAASASDADMIWDQAFGGVSVDLVGSQLLVRSSRTAPTYSPEELINIAGADAATIGFGPGALINVQEYWLGMAAVGATIVGGSTSVVTVTLGVDGTAPGPSDLVGNRAAQTGMFALEQVDLFNILCIPCAAELTDSQMISVVSQAIAYCGERRAIMLVDIPNIVETVSQMQDWLNSHNFRDPNAAVYFPRVIIPDPANDYVDRNVATSGMIAGLYSRTDVARGVWKAPAGVDAVLEGITRVDLKLTDAQNGVLNPMGINCLRAFPIYGDVCWGARTLVGADAMANEWKYVPIRRLALMIEESLFRGTKWVVFEPNDEPLWAKIRQNVSAFMLQLFRQGAFQGTTPKDAFFVKCDSETTTANDRNLGVVNIEVGFAPLKPAEFVVITIQQIPDVAAA